jgi:6-phosphogluconolactonase (cycloisomerase 2 family)
LNDVISGDGGDDTIYGDKGADVLTGGEGADVFVISPGTGSSSLSETDEITDFNVGEDTILLDGGLSFESLSFEETATGDAVIINETTGEFLAILSGTSSEELTVESFISTVTVINENIVGTDDSGDDPTTTDDQPDDPSITRGSGDDNPTGSSGDDNPTESSGDDNPTESSGDDNPTESSGDDNPTGSSGDDNPTGSSGDDNPTGSSGDDNPTGSSGDDNPTGSSGDDNPTGSSGDDNPTGSSGDDNPTGSSGDDNPTGSSGDDPIVGSPVNVIEPTLPSEPPETIDLEDDPGNTPESAYEIPVDEGTFSYNQEVSPDDPVDYYVFTLDSSQSVSISLSSLVQNANIYVLDSSETIIYSSENTDTTDESITVPLDAGTYYIQVESFESQTTTYNLTASFIASSSENTEISSSELVRYNFTYYYNGENTNSDYYTGYVYAEAGTYEVGERYDVVVTDTTIENSFNGLYFISSVSEAPSIAVVNQVFVTEYTDVDVTTETYETYYFGQGLASGVNGLGSEYDFVNINGTFDNFGGDIVSVTDVVLVTPPDDGTTEQPDDGTTEQPDDGTTEQPDDGTTEQPDDGTTEQPDDGTTEQPGVNPNPDDIEPPSEDTPVVEIEDPPTFDPTVTVTEEVLEDPGSTFDTAYGISISSSATTIYSESVSITDSIDTYTFTIDDSQNISISLTEFTEDVDVFIYNNEQTLVTSSVNLGITAESISVPLTAGTYYVEVTLIDTQVTTYNLSVSTFSNFSAPPVTSSPDVDLVRYDFAYFYDGESLDNDAYLGYVYAELGTYEVDTLYDPYPFSSDVGFNGLYYVYDESSAPSDAVEDWVYVSGYSDFDSTGETYTPYYYFYGEPSGFDGLGSEYDFIVSENGNFDGFGFDFYSANGGDPIFAGFERADYEANDRPGGLTSADIDGDGDTDLIVPNSGFDAAVAGNFEGDQVTILRNNGDGSFGVPISLSTGVGPSVIAEDLDGDGDVDLATAHTEEDTLSIFRNDGNGNFAQPITFEAGDRPFMAEAADVDGDGDTDLITINSEELNLFTGNNEGNSLSIHYNDGDGNFEERGIIIVGEGVTSVAADDLDGDGDIDLATTNQAEDNIDILLNDGTGFFITDAILPVGSRPNSIVAVDVDNDSDLDLAVSNFGNFDASGTFGEGESLAILENDGFGNFAAAEFFETEDFPSRLTPTDIDNDGDLDLMMLNTVFTTFTGDREGTIVSLMENNGDGTFTAPESFTVGDIPVGLVVDNLDNNDGLDFATANYESDDVTVYLRSTDGSGTTIEPPAELLGSLTFVEAEFDGVDGVDGIEGANDIQVSPDSRHVYTVGFDDAVAVFSQDETSGELDFVESVPLDGANDLTINPDGSQVYVNTYVDGVAVFDRDSQTGELSLVEIEPEPQSTGTSDFTLTVSPDGQNVYVPYFGSETGIGIYETDSVSGELTAIGQVTADITTGDEDPDEIVVSPDGESVYIFGGANSATESAGLLSVFDRDTTTGDLTFVESFLNGVDGVEGLGTNGLGDLLVTPDGEWVYVTASDEATIAVFDRDTATGQLTFDSTQSPTTGIGFALATTPDGEFIYVNGAGNDVITLEADPITGELTFVDTESATVAAFDLAVSPDGLHVYTASFSDDAVAVLSRDEA